MRVEPKASAVLPGKTAPRGLSITIQPNAPQPCRVPRQGGAALTLSLATAAGSAQTAGSYSVTNIISDGYVPATTTDPTFIDPWGTFDRAGTNNP